MSTNFTKLLYRCLQYAAPCIDYTHLSNSNNSVTPQCWSLTLPTIWVLLYPGPQPDMILKWARLLQGREVKNFTMQLRCVKMCWKGNNSFKVSKRGFSIGGLFPLPPQPSLFQGYRLHAHHFIPCFPNHLGYDLLKTIVWETSASILISTHSYQFWLCGMALQIQNFHNYAWAIWRSLKKVQV